MMTQKTYTVKNQYPLDIRCDADIATAVYFTKTLATDLAFNPFDSVLIATVVSELAVNMIRYASYGSITVSTIEDTYIETIGILLVASDCGPGIEDMDQVMAESYTTSPNSLGQGLPTVNRIMDTMTMTSVLGKGTTITAIKWRNYG